LDGVAVKVQQGDYLPAVDSPKSNRDY
jgi:hypothetical protein